MSVTRIFPSTVKFSRRFNAFYAALRSTPLSTNLSSDFVTFVKKKPWHFLPERKSILMFFHLYSFQSAYVTCRYLLIRRLLQTLVIIIYNNTNPSETSPIRSKLNYARKPLLSNRDKVFAKQSSNFILFNLLPTSSLSV